jgi:hypothetical protein
LIPCFCIADLAIQNTLACKARSKKWIMLWIAPSEKDTDTAALEKRFWAAADQLRANSDLNILRFGIVPFDSLRFADSVAQQQAVIFQIRNLRRTRDLLLPRLLSGQINLKEN